jgi:hypothetical protein
MNLSSNKANAAAIAAEFANNLKSANIETIVLIEMVIYIMV